MDKKFIYSITFIVIFVILVPIWGIRLYTKNASVSGDDTSRQIRYGFTVQNNTNQPVAGASLRAYAPVQKTSTQQCDTIKASHPYERTTDCLGNQVLHFSLPDIPPFGSEIITIKADLKISHDPSPTALTDTAAMFLKSEPHVESKNAVLAGHAASLEKDTPLDTAKSIFRWVAGHIEDIGYQRHARGARYAFTNGKGDCTEYMDLFAALCRAANIPCMRVGGYVSSKNTVLGPSGYHNWAQFYIDGQWYVADPQKGMFMENDSDYIAMRIISNHCSNEMKHDNRYRIKGDGISVKMNP